MKAGTSPAANIKNSLHERALKRSSPGSAEEIILSTLALCSVGNIQIQLLRLLEALCDCLLLF